jgi:hypothetical protein
MYKRQLRHRRDIKSAAERLVDGFGELHDLPSRLT